MADFDVKTDFEDFWKYASTSWQPYFRNADIALSAYAGRTWTDQEREKLRLQNRNPSEFNLIRPTLNFYSGYLRDNLKSTIVGPVEGGDDAVATDLSEVMRFVYDKGQGNQCMLNAFDDAIKAGISLVGIYMDYTRDPIYGDIKFYRRPYNSFVLDPNFQNFDLSDCSQAILRDFVTREEAKALLPNVDPIEIDQIPAFSRDDKFLSLGNRVPLLQNRDLLSYDQYYRYITIEVKEIIDLKTGITMPFDGDKDEEEELMQRLQFARSQGIEAELIKRQKRVVELHIFLTNCRVFSGFDPTGLKEYPFAPVIAYFEPTLSDYGYKLQGMSWPLVDSQRAFNKRMIRKEDIMDSVINTGYFYRVGSVDPEDILQSGTMKLVPASNEADLDRDIKPIQNGVIPQGWQEETSYIQGLFSAISGVNESLLGMDEGGNTQISGRLAEVRAANGVRANRQVFDNFERFQRILGNKVMRTIQLNFSDGKVERIIARQPAQNFFDINFDYYDVTIKEAVQSQTQRDAFYFELKDLVQIFGPDKIPASLLLENLPMAGAEKVREAIEQQEQAAQAAEQEQQEDKRRLARFQESQIQEKLALSQERRARVLSDIGLARERISESQQNRQDAVLKRAKAIAEIEKLSTERLEKLAELMQAFEEIGDAQEDATLNRDMAREQALAANLSPDEGGQFPNIGGQDANV